MKKTVLTYGLISAAVAIVMMAITMPFIHSRQMGIADTLGYTSMFLSALLVFFGVRAYRQQTPDGRLTFGRGLAVGLLITLISTACYIVAFEVVYFHLVPDFGDTFSACMIERTRDSGGTPEQIAATTQQAATLKRLYDHPVTNALLTFATTFPVGLGGALLSAWILRRR